jgi:hypothetical protein
VRSPVPQWARTLRKTRGCTSRVINSSDAWIHRLQLLTSDHRAPWTRKPTQSSCGEQQRNVGSQCRAVGCAWMKRGARLRRWLASGWSRPMRRSGRPTTRGLAGCESAGLRAEEPIRAATRSHQGIPSSVSAARGRSPEFSRADSCGDGASNSRCHRCGRSVTPITR